MFNRKSRLTLAISTAVMLWVTLVASSSPLVRFVGAQAPDEGGGNTSKSEKIVKSDIVSFPLRKSLDKAEAERELTEERAKRNNVEPPLAEQPIPIEPPILLPGGLDYTIAGTGTRNAGHGTIRTRGAPFGSQVVFAHLYWGVIVRDSPPFPTTDTANFEGHQIIGTLVGNSEQPCWVGDANGEFLVYRAVVTQFIPPAINGDYQVDGFASGVTDGSSAWPTCTPVPRLPLAEGASLLIVYSHLSVPAAARIYVHEGPFTFAGQVDITHTLSPAFPAHTSFKHTRVGADGNVGCGVFAQAPLNDEKTYLGTTVANLFQIKGDRDTTIPIIHPALHRDSDWNGYDGATLNMLWDTNTSGFAPSLNAIDPIPAGSASYLIRYRSQGDCIAAVVHVLGVQ